MTDDEKRELYRNAAETVCVDGVWYDRRDTVDALTSLLADERAKVARLTSPADASAMEQATQIVDEDDCQAGRTMSLTIGSG